MSDRSIDSFRHDHVFLGAGHARNEGKTWAVIWLCGLMMVAEIVGGSLFGSLALVADGLHMSTHAGALLLAALAYTYARRHADDPRFAFGTGKLGDLAGFTSAIVLAMIALLIGYEAVMRFIHPVEIRFAEAIPIAVVGLMVNIASAWLLSGDEHHHGHGHERGPGGHAHGEETRLVDTGHGILALEVFEDGVPPRFRVRYADGAASRAVPAAEDIKIETERKDGTRQIFAMEDRGAYLESVDEIPEPHEFAVRVSLRYGDHIHHRELVFTEQGHGHGHVAHRDNNLRAAFVHVLADAAVSVLVIVGLLSARFFGWMWMDPVAGSIGALVIASWAYGLVRDTGSVLLDVTPDRGMADRLRQAIEHDGDRVADLHLWRLGPGHLGAIVSVVTGRRREAAFYREKLARFGPLSHVTVEVRADGAA